VSVSGISELTVPYDPQPVNEKVRRRRRQMRSRLLSLGITVVIMAVIYIWQRDQLQGAGIFVVYGVLLGLSLVWLLVTVIGYLQARKELAGMNSGTAVRIGPPGVQVAGVFAAWPEVASLRAVPGGIGRSPVLQLTTISGAQARVAFDQIPAYPATLDSTARAFSAGRHGVDLSALDS
jgi:hypothetical protein